MEVQDRWYGSSWPLLARPELRLGTWLHFHRGPGILLGQRVSALPGRGTLRNGPNEDQLAVSRIMHLRYVSLTMVEASL